MDDALLLSSECKTPARLLQQQHKKSMFAATPPPHTVRSCSSYEHWWATRSNVPRRTLTAVPQTLVVSQLKSDGFAEQQDGAAPGVRVRVEDEHAVDGTAPPVDLHGAFAFQRKPLVFDPAHRGAQVGHHLLRPADPDRLGVAAGVPG